MTKCKIKIIKEKIKTHIKKNGIKIFGYTPESLNVFTLPELRYLCNYGLIGNEDITKRIMSEEIINNY